MALVQCSPAMHFGLVCGPLKEVFQTRPAYPYYNSTWDTSIVLSYVKTLHPPKEISVQSLTHKLVKLCALVYRPALSNT